MQSLIKQDLFLSRDNRQIADALAKGKLAVTVGPSYSHYEPFLKAALPVRQLPRLKEGSPASNGFGILAVVKKPPHPNATRVFVNWLLSREGQELFTKVMQAGTRRLDVDTRWLADVGGGAAKDTITLDEYHKLRNHLEDKYTQIRVPATRFAEQILK